MQQASLNILRLLTVSDYRDYLSHSFILINKKQNETADNTERVTITSYELHGDKYCLILFVHSFSYN